MMMSHDLMTMSLDMSELIINNEGLRSQEGVLYAI